MNRGLKAEDEFLAGLEAEERSTLVDILRRLAKYGPATASDHNGLTKEVLVSRGASLTRGPRTRHFSPSSPQLPVERDERRLSG
jgi:hypothetical protein